MRKAWLRRPLGAAAIGLLAAGALAAGAATAQAARVFVGSGNVPLFEGASADWQGR